MKDKLNNFTIHLIRYKYLLRLIFTIFTILLVPVLIMTYTLTQRSYREINTYSNEYYTERTFHFSSNYNEQMHRLLDVALRVGLDGKFNHDIIETSPWQRIKAVGTMADYKVAVPMVEHIGICFYDLDHVLTSEYSYTVNRYVDLVTDSDAVMTEALEALLTEDNGERITMLSSFNNIYTSDPRIVITIPISTEFSYKNNAVVLYSLSAASFSRYFIGQLGAEQYGLAVFDNQGIPFFFNQEFDTTLCSDENFLFFLMNSKGQSYEHNTGTGLSRIYRIYDSKTGMFFVSVIPESIVIQRVKTFYDSVGLMIVFMSLVLVLLTGVTVYINYRPLISTVRRIRNLKISNTSMDEYSELKTIEAVLTGIQQKYTEMSVTVSEQQLMLMEYILGNILYGLPIQKEKVENLDSSLLEKSFMVISVQELHLDNEKREQLTHTISEQMGITVYITDIQYEPVMVIICVINDSCESESVAADIEKILRQLYQTNLVTGTGEVVDSLDDIRSSYLNSRKALETHAKASDSTSKAMNHHLERLIFKYVNSNFNQSDIDLVQVADRFNISIYTCSRMFKEFTGIGFKEYISAKRLELSKELLLSTNKNVYEIAAEAGFENPSYFMTWFKANSGMTPSRFRKYSPISDQ